jgi:hypothetical protein
MGDEADLPDDDRQRSNDMRRAIRDLVSALAERCRTARTRREVYWDVLYTGVEALAAHGGAVWEFVAGAPAVVQCGMGPGNQPNAEPSGAWHREQVEPFLAFVAEKRASVIAPPGEGGACPAGVNPTDGLWLFAPIGDARETPCIILQIVQRSGTPESTQQGYLRFLQQICELAGEGLARAVVE